MKRMEILNRAAIRAAAPAPATAANKNKFWNFVDAGGDTATLQLFGTIQSEKSWWSEDNVTYRDFINELNGLGDKKTIRVEINSGGGDVFAANAIYNALLAHKATVEGYVIGLCASAATIVLMACTTRKIAKNALLMVHNPTVTVFGAYSSEELLKLAEVTDKVKASIKTAYKERLDKTDDEIDELMNTETWYVGQEAIDDGFCTDLIEESADVLDFVNGNTMNVNGIVHTFRNDYVETVVPDNVRKKVLEFSNTPQNSGTFLNIKHKKGNENMGENGNKFENVEQLRAAYPEFCNQIENSAIASERARLQAIDKIAAGVPAEMLDKAKYTEPITAEALSYAVLSASNAAGSKFLNNMVDDLGGSGAGSVGSEPGAGAPSGAEDESAARVNGLAGAMKKDRRRGK